MEIAGAVAGEVSGSAVVHVEREFGYLIHFRRSTNALKDNIQRLTATRSHVQAMTDAALRNGELVNEPVQDWMRRADLVLLQANMVSNEASIINSWFRGWCCGRFSLGRKAQKTIEVVQRIHEEGSGFSANSVSYHKPTQSLNLVGTEDFNAFASRDFTAEEIRKALLDDETNLVGVYGMPGVGKTSLIKAIAKQVKEEQLFQEVVVVIVSQNPSLIKLQGYIAEGLDLSLTEENLSVRADRLSERLNQDSNTTLVILDDVWERIDLSELGIPYRNKGKCCKVVFTTRFGGLCDRMEANSKIEVAVLPEEDSWILFQNRSGNVADSALARDVLRECNGLPLALATLGRALRNKDAIVWADTLVQLRKSILKGMSSVVSSIKLSYDFLESESVKICFLFCCLFPEDHVIGLGVLLYYVMGEKLLEDVDTYDEARGRLYGIVDELVSSGLLLRYEDEGIMVHDVIRDVAISIAAEEEGHIVKAGRNLREWPDMELGNCKRLSMMGNPIESFSTFQIKAPHLQALFLNDNSSLTELPSDFFADMKSLRTLDLSGTYIESLPPSLSCLQKLRTLLVNRDYICNLLNLYPIEKLESLEVLSLRYSEFTEEFPEGIGNLSNLRILDLTGAEIKGLRRDLFSKLRRLEEFHVLQSSISETSRSTKTNIVYEIGSWSRLTSFEVQVYNPELCYIDILGPWQNLTTFQIVIRTEFEGELGVTGFSRNLWLDGIRVKEVANWVLVLLGRTNYLQLILCGDLQSLTELGSAAAKGMSENLKSLSIYECSKMECLVCNTGLYESNENAFSNLEVLYIEGINAFVEICKGTPPTRLLYRLKTLTFEDCKGLHTAIPRKLIQSLPNLRSLFLSNCDNLLHLVQMEEEEEESLVSSNIRRISEPLVFPIFPNLKDVKIENSPKIRYVFTMRVARNLLQLEELDIRGCSEIEVIFKYEDGEDIQCDQQFKHTAILPSLKELRVWNAQKLKSFTTQNLVMELPTLESVDVYNCASLERLPFGPTSVPNLNTLDMKQEIFDRLEWEDDTVKARLQGFLK